MPSPEIGLQRRDPITCHVLDQTTGNPASSLQVRLTLLRPDSVPKHYFVSETSAEGRIMEWTPCVGAQDSFSPSLADVLKSLNQEHESSDEATVWSLIFETERYFGKGKTFFPEVEVKFLVDRSVGEGGHVHVPLLLAPWGYTTYRGS